MTKRTVIITGAAKGIGKAVAERFAAAGDRVAIVDIDGGAAEATAATLPSDRAIAIEADVTDESAVRSAVKKIVSAYSEPHVLVNNAGISQTAQPIDEQTIVEWQNVIKVHLRGTYLWSRFVLPRLMDEGRGCVINLSSIAGLGAFPHRTAYGPAKAAINNLTQVLAVEAAPVGVTVNAIAPGYVRTPMVEELIECGELDPGPLEDRTPIGKLATPDQIADAVAFLASDQASYITGIVLPVDGGWSAYGHV